MGSDYRTDLVTVVYGTVKHDCGIVKHELIYVITMLMLCYKIKFDDLFNKITDNNVRQY